MIVLALVPSQTGNSRNLDLKPFEFFVEGAAIHSQQAGGLFLTPVGHLESSHDQFLFVLQYEILQGGTIFERTQTAKIH